MALPAKLVRNMPQDHIGVSAVTLGQQAVDRRSFLTIDRRGIAVVVPGIIFFPHTGFVHPAHLRIFFRHPPGTGCTGRRQNRFDAFGCQVFDNTVKLFKMILSLIGLQHRPGKNTHRHTVAVGLLHHFRILRQNFRISKPLVRIIIRTVQKMRM